MSRSSIIPRPEAVIGLDVGKFSHWAYGIGAAGDVTADFPVDNREAALDSFFASVEPGTLVVVDQARNIGALAISRARLAGLDVAYLPGLAEHNAAKLFAGDAKTDARDAEVIAKTALGIPDALRPAPDCSGLVSAARRLASQRDFAIADSTHDKNRLRAIPLESRPEFESLVDLSDDRQVNLLVFSCNSLMNSKNRFGEHYRMLRDVRHMPHGKALKAVARKRLKVIYAIMRDKVPYAA